MSDPNTPGGAYGTAGFIATGDGSDRWVVSCYHVLCRKNADFPAGESEPIYHPVSQLQPAPIATVSLGKANRELDCAAARIIAPGFAVGHVLGIGSLIAPVDPVVGMRVIKSGAETGVTEGRISNVTGDIIEIAPLGYPSGYELSEGGDSGALWIDASTHAPIALHYRGSERGTPERAYGKAIRAVLDVLKLEIFNDI